MENKSLDEMLSELKNYIDGDKPYPETQGNIYYENCKKLLAVIEKCREQRDDRIYEKYKGSIPDRAIQTLIDDKDYELANILRGSNDTKD